MAMAVHHFGPQSGDPFRLCLAQSDQNVTLLPLLSFSADCNV